MSQIDTLLAEIRRRREARLPRVLNPGDADLLADEIDRLAADNRRLQGIVTGLADRVAAQSALLSRRAEKAATGYGSCSGSVGGGQFTAGSVPTQQCPTCEGSGAWGTGFGPCEPCRGSGQI